MMNGFSLPAMKIALVIIAVALSASMLSACGGSPMSVESRTASTDRNAAPSLEEQIRIHQRIQNSRGAY